MVYTKAENALSDIFTRLKIVERALSAMGRRNPPLPTPIELIRTATDSISANTTAEFNITANGRPSITTEKALLVAVTFKAWAAVTGGNGLRIGLALSDATPVNWNDPTWGDVIRATSSSSVMVTKYVIFQPGTTFVSVFGHRETTTNAPGCSYQILQVTPIRYV